MITLIENIELRTRLVALRRWKQTYENFERDDGNFLTGRLFPFFQENALLPQIAMTPSALSRPGEDGELAYEYAFSVDEKRDHSDLVRDPVFQGLLMEKLWIQLDSANDNNEFLADSDALIRLLEQEIREAG